MEHIKRTCGRTLLATALLGAAGVLGGCFQTNQPGAHEAFLSAEEIAAKDDKICQSYGAKPGTPEYINCRGQQDQRRTVWRAAN
jgi:hypothetical protein